MQQQNFAELGKDYRPPYRQQQRPRYFPIVFVESVSSFIPVQQLHIRNQKENKIFRKNLLHSLLRKERQVYLKSPAAD